MSDASPSYNEYMDSEEWKSKKQQRLDFADHRCELCNRQSELHVHHRTYERFGDEKLGDLIVLCRRCHDVFHHRLTLHSPEEVPEGAEVPEEERIGHAAREAIETAVEEVEGHPQTLDIGLDRLNDVVTGLHSASLTVVGGRSGAGVGDLVRQIAYNVASNDNRVLYFTTQSPARRFSQKLLSTVAQVDRRRVMSSSMEEEEWQRMAAAAGQISELDMFVQDTPDPTVEEIKEGCRSTSLHQGLDLVVIDRVDGVRFPAFEDRWREKQYPHIMREIKSLALRLDVPVIVTTHLGREVEEEGGNKRPALKHLASDAMVSESEAVWLLYRAEMYGITITEDGNPTEGFAEIDVARNAFGKSETIDVCYEERRGRFYDLKYRGVSEEEPDGGEWNEDGLDEEGFTDDAPF